MKPSLIRILTLCCLLALSDARAHTLDILYNCGSGTSSSTYTGYVDVGRDAQVGEVMGPWISLAPVLKSCGLNFSGGTIPKKRYFPSRVRGRFTIGGNGVDDIWGTIVHEGNTYTVYRAGQVGFILEWYFIAKDHQAVGLGPVHEVTGNVNQVLEREVIWHTYTGPNGADLPGEIWLRNILMVRMVKISPAYPQANSSVSFQMGRFSAHTGKLSNAKLRSTPHTTPGGIFSWHAGGGSHEMYVNIQFGQVNAACETPDVTVPLGTQHLSQLRLPHQAAPQAQLKTFTVEFKQCPRYLSLPPLVKFVPVPPAVDASLGVLSLEPHSTATGIGVQIRSENGIPLNFSKNYFLNGHKNVTYADPSVPFRPPYYASKKLLAHMVRLPGQTPEAGTVHAQMKVVVTYK